MQIRRLALVAGIIALALTATAFFHVCLHSIDDNEAADSKHHCLFCMVFSHTILSFDPLSFLPTQLRTNRRLLLMPVSSEGTSVRASAAVRAPPRLGWN